MSRVEPAEWIKVDSRQYEEQTPVKDAGVEFQVVVSPYDVPEAVRGKFDSAKQRFVIDFKYIGSEPMEVRSIDDHVNVLVGKNSHRLFRIETDVEALGAHSVGLHLVTKGVTSAGMTSSFASAIDKLRSSFGVSKLPEDNFDVTKRIISDKKDELVQTMVGSAI